MSRIWPNGGTSSPPSPGNARPDQAFRSTNEYGTDHSLTGWHRGIDLVGFDWIRAVDDGTVVFSGSNGTAGYEIKIRHTDLTSTRYLHMEFGSLRYITGQKVKQGDIIGKMGATGYVTGKHLHFECIQPDGSTRINPRKYINPEVVLGGDGATPFDPSPQPEEEEDMTEDERNMLRVIYNTLTAGAAGVKDEGEIRRMIREAKGDIATVSDKTDQIIEKSNQIIEEMNPMNAGFYYETTRDGKPITVYLLMNTGSGWYNEFSNGPGNGPMPADYNNGLARSLKTGTWAKITESHARALKASADLIRSA